MATAARIRHSSIGVGRGAFTLIELVVVMAIVGLLTAVAVPVLGGSQSAHRADAAARRLASDLALAQSLAHAASAPRGVRIDPATESYETIEPGDPAPVATGRVDLNAPPIHALIGSARLPADRTIWFDGHAMPGSGAEVRVGVGETWWAVVVDPGAGFVTSSRAAGPDIAGNVENMTIVR